MTAAIRAFVERTGADELMIVSQIFDHEARLRSYEIAAEAMEAWSRHPGESRDLESRRHGGP